MNLASGEAGPSERAVCQFCDTDFVGADGLGGGKFAEAERLAEAVAKCWDAAIGKCWDAAVESPSSPLPLSREGRGDVLQSQGTALQRARPTPSPLAGEGRGEG